MTDSRWVPVLGALAAISIACAAGRDVLVQLETHRPQVYDPRQIEVQAMVLGPQSALHYKWYSVNGDFDPQESYEPKTQFTFAPNSIRDRIWVEVWRDNEKVAESAMDVNVESRPRPSTESTPAPEIAITRVPRYQAEGGPDTRDTIGGTVRTPIPGDYKVVVYARADAWYIQPTPFSMQPIEADTKWQTWTHTGSSYAALVVRKTYKPLTRLDVLPQIDADVVARAIVDGRK
ncbi:MAG TPA: hypothetical protein VJS39_09100 [Gemmatimonadaceae bacterium]|nr:hypothetical protein [Gemmatimonadaceae bacterium]